VVKLLLATGPDLDATDNRGRTATIWACLNGNAGAVRLLSSWRADLSVKDRDGKTAMNYARELGNTEIIGILKDHC
jgi:ankyrin repeat protein